MARLLARLLLLQAGYSHVAYGSLEAVLEKDKGNFLKKKQCFKFFINFPNLG